jgi:hypothetical protein
VPLRPTDFQILRTLHDQSTTFRMNTSEASTLTPSTPVPAQQPTSISKVPLLGEGFKESTSRQAPRPGGSDSSDVDHDGVEITAGGARAGKRRLFGFGKKRKDDEKSKGAQESESAQNGTAATADVPIAQPIAQRVQAATQPLLILPTNRVTCGITDI